MLCEREGQFTVQVGLDSDSSPAVSKNRPSKDLFYPVVTFRTHSRLGVTSLFSPRSAVRPGGKELKAQCKELKAKHKEMKARQKETKVGRKEMKVWNRDFSTGYGRLWLLARY
ncbi:hypothetical protein, partial [Roseiarcus sp.]|uniref:hypothetical protein n=1 Tax=Roseiarcus sp. TaxID=1969460 RepID=UPI003C3398B0